MNLRQLLLKILASVACITLVWLSFYGSNIRHKSDLVEQHSKHEPDISYDQMKNVTLTPTQQVSGKEYMNPHPFKVIVSNRDLCKVDDLFLVVYVHSAVRNTHRRAMIRETWGNIDLFPTMRILFVLGEIPGDPYTQQSLDMEASSHQDILQEKFVDNYRNLTYKGIAALKWISENCNHSRYILKTDDDVFVNMYTVLHHLQSAPITKYHNHVILCLVWQHAKANRRNNLSKGEYHYPYSHFPTYCSGLAFLLTTDLAYEFYQASLNVTFFWVDDVYITGLLPRVLGSVQHRNLGKAYCNQQQFHKLFKQGTTWYECAFIHIHNDELFFRVCNRIIELAGNNSIPTPKTIVPNILS